jgi:hypothetical protein
MVYIIIIILVFGGMKTIKKESLQEIADQLKSTHNNLMLDTFFEKK